MKKLYFPYSFCDACSINSGGSKDEKKETNPLQTEV